MLVPRGGMGTRQREAVAERLAAELAATPGASASGAGVPDGGAPAARNCVLLATGRNIGEGFDDPWLDTLFLAMPVAWRGTLQQYVGRLHRLNARHRTLVAMLRAVADLPVDLDVVPTDRSEIEIGAIKHGFRSARTSWPPVWRGR